MRAAFVERGLERRGRNVARNFERDTKPVPARAARRKNEDPFFALQPTYFTAADAPSAVLVFFDLTFCGCAKKSHERQFGGSANGENLRIKLSPLSIRRLRSV